MTVCILAAYLGEAVYDFSAILYAFSHPLLMQDIIPYTPLEEPFTSLYFLLIFWNFQRRMCSVNCDFFLIIYCPFIKNHVQPYTDIPHAEPSPHGKKYSFLQLLVSCTLLLSFKHEQKYMPHKSRNIHRSSAFLPLALQLHLSCGKCLRQGVRLLPKFQCTLQQHIYLGIDSSMESNHGQSPTWPIVIILKWEQKCNFLDIKIPEIPFFNYCYKLANVD